MNDVERIVENETAVNWDGRDLLQEIEGLKVALRRNAEYACRKWAFDTCNDHGRSGKDGPDCGPCVARAALGEV